MSNNGEILTDGDWAETLPTPSPGEYLWTRTRFMLTDGTFDMIYNVSLYGESGDDGLSIATEKEQYYLSTANNSLTGGEWVYAQPLSIPAGRYLFRRWEFTMSDGTKQYSNAIYNSIMEGVINLTDELDQKITQKIWSTDIDTSISAYDNSTVSTIRSQLSQHEQTMDSISDNIQDFQSSVNGDLTTMSNRMTTNEQTLDGFMQTVTNQQSTMSGDISTLQSATTSLTQTADDFRFFVARSGDGAASSTTLSITANGATMVGDSLTIKSPDNSRTVISGGKISTDLVKSNNYAYSSGTYSTAGTFFDLSNGAITSKNFTISSNGNAYFRGEINATALTLGSGVTVPYTSISGRPDLTVYIAKDGTIGSTPASGATGFKVSSAGLLQASNAVIYGSIYASSGKIGGYTISSASNTGTTANGGHAYTTSFYGHSGDGTYEYEVGLKSDATSTSGSGNLAFYVKRITAGAAWSTATNVFYVTHAGALYAQNANITGTVNATSGSFTGTITTSNITATGGKIGGFNLNQNQLYYMTDVSAATSSNPLTQYRVNIIGNATNPGDNAFVVSNRTYDGTTYGSWVYPFYVHYDGSMVSTKGTIGGWTITSASLKSRANNKTTGMQKQGSGDWAIAVGATDDSQWVTAPFRVNHSGKMYADGAEIEGKITADTGRIGGFTINSDSLSVGSVSSPTSSGIKINAGSSGVEVCGDHHYIGITGSGITWKYGASSTFTKTYWISTNVDGMIGLYPDKSSTTRYVGIWDSGDLLRVYGTINCSDLIRGHVYSGGNGVLVGSNGTDGNRVSHFGCNATALAVSAQWGTTGSSYSTKNVTMNSSDIRIKDNILDTKECGVGFIDQIRLAEFDWKDGSGHKSIGIIADELEKLNPELVIGGGYDEDGCMNIKSIDTLELLSYAIKAIQELSDEIKQLKGEKG